MSNRRPELFAILDIPLPAETSTSALASDSTSFFNSSTSHPTKTVPTNSATPSTTNNQSSASPFAPTAQSPPTSTLSTGPYPDLMDAKIDNVTDLMKEYTVGWKAQPDLHELYKVGDCRKTERQRKHWSRRTHIHSAVALAWEVIVSPDPSDWHWYQYIARG
jgi:hypothetical protein